MTAVIGEQVWIVNPKFRIVIGPMRLAEFQRFLPGSPSLRRLVDWVRNYIGDELLWDVNLVLHVAMKCRRCNWARAHNWAGPPG